MKSKNRKLSETEEMELVELYRQGWKTKDLAIKFEIAQITVQKYLHRNNISLRPNSEECKKYSSAEERKELYKSYYKEWRNNNKDSVMGYRAKAKKEGKYKIHNRLAKYGLKPGDYEKILEEQNFTCPICGLSLEILDHKKNPDIDHCHKTGNVRGIVHNKCNRLLACAEDNLNNLERAIEYLKRNLDYRNYEF